MKHFEITDGKTVINLPSLTFGTASFEKPDNKAEYKSFLDRYCELGGDCIDTARVYCAWLEGADGLSEQTIGEWLSEKGNSFRDKITLVTKGAHPRHETIHISRLSEAEIRSDIEESLKALRTDYIDIYYLHRDDQSIPVEEIMPVLDKLVKEGKARTIGASNWETKRIEQANNFAKKNGLTPFIVSQINYSLAHLSRGSLGDMTQVCMDTEEFAWYLKNDFPVMAFSPQAKGFFSKMISGEAMPTTLEHSYISTANLARLARVKELSQKTGISPAAIVLGYLNSQPIKVSSVFGVTKLYQLDDSMTAADVVFDKATLAFLDNRL